MDGDPVDALYGGGRAEFVAARNRLVRKLKTAGEPERAAEVAQLRRPSVAAWAVNQLARRHPDDVDGLLRAGARLRAAQDEALAGGDPENLRDASRARRDALARLVDQAVGLLAEQGSSPDAHRDAITATLDAASLDAEAGEAVRRGRLSSGLAAPSGFGDDLRLGAPQREAQRDARSRARQEARQRRAEAERAEARVVAARRRRDKAAAEVEAAEHALSAARRRAREVADELADAEREAAETRTRAERATSAADG